MSEETQKKKRGLIIAANVCSLLFILLLIPWLGMILAFIAARTVPPSDRTIARVTLALSIVAAMANVAVIVIPGFVRLPIRSRAAEAKVNLAGIEIRQLAFRDETGFFAGAAPIGNPGRPERAQWRDEECSSECSAARPDRCNFSCIGFRPTNEGVFYQYACNATENAFTCAASADLDGDGDFGAFVFVHADELASPAPVPALPGTQHCGLAVVGEIVDCGPGTL